MSVLPRIDSGIRAADSTAGFHDGELAVQERAGVRRDAARLSGMLAPPDLSGGASMFLAQRDLAVLTARDRDGRLWTSLVTGSPGFLAARGTSLLVRMVPGADDPLGDLAAGQPIGVVAIDFATRRRFRINGALDRVDASGLLVTADQAYGNCPQYIQQRHLAPTVGAGAGAGAGPGRRADRLDESQERLIRRADTFFLGTTHPTRGVDASHRGGTPGFVRVEAGELWWPDYPGNNMFNSLGNIAADGTAALLFLDFATGVTLHLSGTAVVEWTAPGATGDDGGTGRRVRFTPASVVTGAAAFRAADLMPWPRNFALTDTPRL